MPGSPCRTAVRAHLVTSPSVMAAVLVICLDGNGQADHALASLARYRAAPAT